MADEKRQTARHEHGCGHDCECAQPSDAQCDRCDLADVVIRRHDLGAMSKGEALARLYLSLMIVAGEGHLSPTGLVINDMMDLERAATDWSR